MEPSNKDLSPSHTGSPVIKIEDDIINPAFNKYVCAECGKTCVSYKYLDYHFKRVHSISAFIFPFICPVVACGRPFAKENNRKLHYTICHGKDQSCPYPWCTSRPDSLAKLLIHITSHETSRYKRGHYECLYPDCSETSSSLTRLTQHAYLAHPGIAKQTGCPECQEKLPSDKALYLHYQTSHPFSSAVTLKCPASDCAQSFRNPKELYHHYLNSNDSSHPAYVHYDKPPVYSFKCPFTFCAIAYTHEIRLGIHNAVAHRWDAGGDSNEVPSQGHRVSNTVPDVPRSSTDEQFALEIQDEDLVNRRQEVDVEDLIEITEGNAIRVETEMADYFEPDTTNAYSHSLDPHGSQKRTIGYVLSPPSPLAGQSGRLGTSVPETYAYPDEAALDEHERTLGEQETDFPSKQFGRNVLQRLLALLQVAHILPLDELSELWSGFLGPDQRSHAMQQLKKIGTQQSQEEFFARLRGTSLAYLINAWLDFKSHLARAPPQLRNAQGARNTAWAVLMHCMILEELRRRALPTAIDLGLIGTPDRLRFPTSGYDLSAAHATFAEILNALAERAACRKVNPEWLQLTNVMVLVEAGRYIDELKEVVLVLYPGEHENREWVETYGID